MVLHAVSARFARLLAAACVTALSVLTVGAASARAAETSLTLNYNCAFPLIGSQSVAATYGEDLPGSVTQGVPASPAGATANITMPPVVEAGLALVGAATVAGSAVGNESVTDGAAKFGGSVPYTVPATNVPASGAFTLRATGTFPSVTFPDAGTADLMVGNLTLTLTPRDGHGRLTALGTFTASCTAAPGQDNVLGSFPVHARATSTALAGDRQFAGSTSRTVRGGVMTPTTTVLTSSVNPSVQGQTVIYTATVSPAGGGGSVAFSDGSTPVNGCTAVGLNASGQATCRVSYATTGSHNITAVYSGDATHDGSVSGVLTQNVVVDRADLMVRLTVPATAAPGAIVSQTVTVTNLGPATASTEVTALDEPYQLAVINANGALVRGPLLTWSMPSLAPGRSVNFFVTVQVGARASGTVVVVAGALSVTPDPDMANNTSTGQMTLG